MSIIKTEICEENNVIQLSRVKMEYLSQNDSENKQSPDEQKSKKQYQIWGNLQKMRYLLYLTDIKTSFGDENQQLKGLFYKKMSLIIGNSSNETCGMHHRSYLKKYTTIQGIIDNLKLAVYFENYDQVYNERKRICQILNSFQNENIRKAQYPQITNYQIQHAQIEQLQSENSLQVDKSSQQVFSQQQKHKNLNVIIPTDISIVILQKKQQDQQSNFEKEKIMSLEYMFQKDKISLQTISPTKTKLIRKTRTLPKSTINVSNRKKQKMSSSQQDIMSSKQSIIIPKLEQNQQIHYKNQKSQSTGIWSKSQSIKMLIYLNIKKQTFYKGDWNQKRTDLLKLSEYINTNKTPNDCRQRIFTLYKKYNKKLQSMIDQQTKRHEIPQELIEQERKKLQFVENGLQCEIILQPLIIKDKINQDEMSLSEIRENKQNDKLEVPLQIVFQSKSRDNQQQINGYQFETSQNPKCNYNIEEQELNQKDISSQKIIQNQEIKVVVFLSVTKSFFQILVKSLNSSNQKEIIKEKSFIWIRNKQRNQKEYIQVHYFIQ